MVVGLYMWECGSLDNAVKEILETRGVVVHVGTHLDERANLEGIDVVVCHPGAVGDPGGPQDVRAHVVAHPEVLFYILAGHKQDRRQTIGEHPNVRYVTFEYQADFFTSIHEYVARKKEL